MDWFRFYSDVVNDPKIQRLPAELFKRWVNILCVARKHDGLLPGLPDLAFLLRSPEDAVKDDLETLIKADLIDRTDVGLSPHKWAARQYQSGSSTDRVRRFREREREKGAKRETDTDTEQKRYSVTHNGNVSRSVSLHTADADVFFESEFWPIYPRKVGKSAALKAFRRHGSTANKRAAILAGLKAHLPELESREVQYVPYPATWLNQERWADPVETGNQKPAGEVDYPLYPEDS